jgi:hypothetical protein
MVQRERFDVVGLSLGSELHLDGLAACIRAVRKAAVKPHVGIMVNGPIFGRHPEFVSRVGADAASSDGRAAPEVAAQLSANRKAGSRACFGTQERKLRMQEGSQPSARWRFTTPNRFFRHRDADIALVLGEVGAGAGTRWPRANTRMSA